MYQLQQKVQPKDNLDTGLLRTARYAFMPNRLSYCGPDMNRNLFEYISDEHTDPGLNMILEEFQTLYPYLMFIAQANQIDDPFDERVVMAYWLGNSLLDRVSPNSFFRYLEDDLKIKKKIDTKSKHNVYDKLPKGAHPNHAFHVLNIFRRTGHVAEPHTLETMNNCKISAGRVAEVQHKSLLVETKSLEYVDNKLIWGKRHQKELPQEISSRKFLKNVQKGDLVTYHWGFVCEKVTKYEVAYLNKYTNKAIELANLR